MNLLDKLKNTFFYNNKYRTDSEAVIIACYFNPQNNEYRKKGFDIFYDSIKHLNHRIVEGVIGDAEPQLPATPSISRIYTKDLLWHKEALLNAVIKDLPQKFKYVFWLDTDVIFTNKDWLIQGVEELKYNNIIQPFEYCVHLDEGETKPSFDVAHEKQYASDPKLRHKSLWRSFCANFKTNDLSGDTNYDKHGHVGFAWGAKRSVLETMPLYDRALIGGADHIIAHAAAGQIGHSCLQKSFTEDIDAINDWSEDFEKVIDGKISFVVGELHHIWHGDIAKRQYLKRIQEFTPKAKQITKKDANGLYVADELNGDTYMKEYFDHREDTSKPNLQKPIGHPQTRPKRPTSRPIDTNISRQEYIEIPREEFGLNLTDFVEGVIVDEIIENVFEDSSVEFENGQNQETGFEDGFGGGGFSGGGSGGSWEEPSQDTTDTTDYSQSENFS